MSTSTPELSVVQLAEWLAEQRWSQFAQSLADYFCQHRTLTPNQLASARRMYAKCAERNAQRNAERPAQAVAQALPNGFYFVAGVLYKVVTAKHGGKYAVRRGENGGWVYDRGAIRALTPDQKVTAEQAVQHGLATGVCLFCNAELDDRDGLGRIVGVGPVCARKHLGMTQRQLASRLAIAIPEGVTEAR